MRYILLHYSVSEGCIIRLLACSMEALAVMLSSMTEQ